MKQPIVAALAALLLLAGCAHAQTNAAASASAGPSLFYPPGIVPPGDWAAQMHDGIYAAEKLDECCFLAGSAHLTLDNPKGAQLAVFKFFVPAVQPFLHGRERVSLALEGVAAGPPIDLSGGIHDVTFTIPASLRAKRHLSASLVMSVKWVPKRIGVNADERELSIMLLRVGYI
jgi:hypothetical protein